MNLSSWIGPARARWNALAARERRVAAVLVLFLGAVFFYVLVWSPVQGGLAHARTRLAAVKFQLAQVQEQAALVEKHRNAPRSAPPADAAGAVEQAAQRHGLREQLKRVDAEGAGRVRVQIEGASFSALTAWLAELQQRGLRAESAAIERQANPGTVNLRLLLRGQDG
jgi:type II secretory pathway component PulM